MQNEINVQAKEGVLTILEGKAADPINPKRQYFLGCNIRGVVDYVIGRKKAGVPVDPQTSVVVIDESNFTITLTTDSHLHEQGGVTVQAKLEPNPRLEEFKINASGVRFSLKELEKLVNFNADMFSKSEHANAHGMLLASLRTFTAKANIEIQEAGDKRGNKAQNFTKTVTTDIVNSFVLRTNIFKGTEIKTFYVDICYEITDGGVKFWLESTELFQLTLHEMKVQFDSQKTYLSDSDEGTAQHGLVVISK